MSRGFGGSVPHFEKRYRNRPEEADKLIGIGQIGKQTTNPKTTYPKDPQGPPNGGVGTCIAGVFLGSQNRDF